jgi:hypothetical protein
VPWISGRHESGFQFHSLFHRLWPNEIEPRNPNFLRNLGEKGLQEFL